MDQKASTKKTGEGDGDRREGMEKDGTFFFLIGTGRIHAKVVFCGVSFTIAFAWFGGGGGEG